MGKNVKKTIALIVLILLLPFSLSGCYNSNDIESLSYVVAIGIDKSEESIIKLTLQFSKPESSSNSQSAQSESSTDISIDTTSIDAGITMINSYISKKVGLAHCKIVVISEELAAQGVSPYINTLVSNLEIRPDCNIIISKSSASDYLKYAKPTLTKIPARYYDSITHTSENTALSVPSPLWEFNNKLQSDTQSAVATLAGIISSETSAVSAPNLLDQNFDYTAGETPIEGDTLTHFLGLAAFKDDKLVGELSAMDTIAYMLLTNTLDHATVSIPDPFNLNSSIVVTINLKKDTINKVELVNNSPFITSNIYLETTIQALEYNSNYSDNNDLQEIEKYLTSFIKAKVSDFVYKTAKEYNSDLVGFGKNLITSSLTIDDWEDKNWENIYSDSFFKINVSSNIKAGNIFIKN